MIEQGQFHLFRIHQNKFQLRRVFAVEQADQHGIESNRFSLTCGTCHEQVRHFGQIEDIRFVGNGLSHGNGQGCFGLVEFVGRNQRAHRDDVRIGIGYFNANGPSSWDGGNDSNAQSG